MTIHLDTEQLDALRATRTTNDGIPLLVIDAGDYSISVTAITAGSKTPTAKALDGKEDGTAARRQLLEPYPVTKKQAVERLGCSYAAATSFLQYCVRGGKLRRVGFGVYDRVNTSTAPEAT